MNKENREQSPQNFLSNEPNESKSLKDYELDDAKVVAKVLRDYEEDKKSRDQWDQIRQLVYKRYRQVSVRRDPFEGCSNVVIPILSSNIDSIIPRANAAFLQKNPPVTVMPTEENDKIQAKITEKFFNKYLLDKLNYEDVIDEMNFGTVLYGTSFLKDFYENEQIKLVSVDANDIYIPFYASCDINDLAHVIHRWYKDRWTLSQRYKVGLEQFGKYTPESTGTQLLSEQLEGRVNTDDDSDQPVECVEWYGKWIIGNELKDIVAIVAVKERLLLAKWFLAEVVPYAKDKRRLPINRIRMKKVSGCAYGVGLGEDLAGMHDWTNSVVNAILDGNYWSIIPWGVKQEGSKLNVSDVKPHFGMMLNVPSIDAIKFMNIPNQTAPMVDLLPYIQAMTERVGGISDYGMGRESEVAGNSATATGTLAIIKEMGVRLDGYIAKASQDIKYTLQNIFYWIQATIDEYEIVRTLGDSVNPKDVQILLQNDPLKYDLNININYGYASRDIERKNNFDTYQMAMSNPQLAANPKFMEEITKKLLENAGQESLAELIDTGNQEYKLQLKEISKMLQGDTAEVHETDEHMEHIRCINQYKGTEAYEKATDMAKQMIEQHEQRHYATLDMLKQVVMAQGGIGPMPPNGQIPINGAQMGQGIPMSPNMSTMGPINA